MRNSPQRVDFKFWVFNFSLRDQMGEWWFRVLFVGCLVFGVNGYPKEDLVESLPGQPKVGFRQYAGYVDVDLKNGRSLFYYFVEAEKDPDHMPLTLWLNGGPGCSSVGGGAFTELGPFYPKGDGRGLRRNSMSWNKASNLLFVESPAGVGWSYSNTSSDYNSGDESTARDMLTFMLKWFEKFPAFKSRDLFLTGESYAGHYIPQLAVAMLEYNAHSNGFKFNIKGIAIGNPLLKLDRDVPSTYEFLWSHGMISDEIGLAIMKDCDFEDYTFSSPHNTTDSCNNAVEEANRIVGNYINSYDVILDVCYPSIVEQELRLRKLATKISVGIDVCMSYERRFYFNLPEVQKALHANRTNLPYSWSMCSDILNYSNTDGNIDILPLLKRIIQNHIPVWIFSGDQDSVVPLLGSRTLVRELAHDLHFKVTVPYGAWFHKHQNESQVSGNLEALYKQHNQRLTTNKHPQTQPSSPVQKLQSFSFQNIQMASPVTDFPHFLPPPPPAAKPPSSPPRPRPPPPHILPPPPPPHITPPPPDHGPTVIVIVFISFGGLFLLAFFAIAVFCFIKKTKKKKKMVQETDIIHVDEHLKVKKGIVQGPHGAEAVVLAVEDDVHVVEEIKKNENFVEGKHAKSTDNISRALEEGTSSSSSTQHHSLEHKP